MPEHPIPDRWERDTLIQLSEQVKGLRYDVNRHAESDDEMYRKIDANFQTLRSSIDSKFVTKVEFNPTRLIAYGVVGIILTVVITALIRIVVGGKIAP